MYMKQSTKAVTTLSKLTPFSKSFRICWTFIESTCRVRMYHRDYLSLSCLFNEAYNHRGHFILFFSFDADERYLRSKYGRPMRLFARPPIRYVLLTFHKCARRSSSLLTTRKRYFKFDILQYTLDKLNNFKTKFARKLKKIAYSNTLKIANKKIMKEWSFWLLDIVNF